MAQQIPQFKDVCVGGRNFRVFHLDARTAVHVQTRLAGVLGPGFVHALSTITPATIRDVIALLAKTDKDVLKDNTRLQDFLANECGSLLKPLLEMAREAVSGIATRLDDATADYVIDAIFKKCSWFQATGVVEGIPVSMELFEGRPLDVWALLLEGLKFNFAPFIAGFQRLSSPQKTA